MRSPRSVPILLLVILGVTLVAAPATAAPDVVRYRAPTTAEVLRDFQAPESLFGAGHRGVDLAAKPGDQVYAAADGRVVFAGAVAGDIWISIDHDDGITTSYGPLTGLLVRQGEAVRHTQVIARLAAGGHGSLSADPGLHWGARRGTRYLDPLSLLEVGIPRPSLVGAGGWKGTGHAVVPYEPWAGGRWWGLGTSASPVADRPGFAVAPNPNHLLLVPGLASTSDSRVLEASHLGYDLRSVTRFSYAGRHDARGDPADPSRDQLPYGHEDTWAGPGPAAAALAEQLRAQARREPGRAVDLIGHSMGGLVILTYLLEHHDPFDRSLPPVGNVVTIASPLEGSDTASIGGALRDAPLVGQLVGRLQDRGYLGGDHLPLDAPAIDQLAVGSETLGDLATAFEQALADGTAGPLATGTRMLNIGGSTDLIVSSDRTAWEGAARDRPPAEPDGRRVVVHRVLPGGHTGVTRTEALREVTWRFLAGQEVVASPGLLSRHVGGELADTLRRGAELVPVPG